MWAFNLNLISCARVYFFCSIISTILSVIGITANQDRESIEQLKAREHDDYADITTKIEHLKSKLDQLYEDLMILERTKGYYSKHRNQHVQSHRNHNRHPSNGKGDEINQVSIALI